MTPPKVITPPATTTDPPTPPPLQLPLLPLLPLLSLLFATMEASWSWLAMWLRSFITAQPLPS